MTHTPRNNMVVCSPLYWAPPISYFSFIRMFTSELIIEGNESYQKRSFRNKTLIHGANGRHRMSLPLQKGKHQKTPIKEVKLSYNEPWQRQHLTTLQSAYGSSPYFSYYYPLVEELYQGRATYLFDWNMQWLSFFHTHFALDVHISHTSVYERDKSNYIVDLRKQEIPQLKELGMRLNADFWYNQVFEEKHGFDANVGGLDLLFCTGPEAPLYLDHYWLTKSDE